MEGGRVSLIAATWSWPSNRVRVVLASALAVIGLAMQASVASAMPAQGGARVRPQATLPTIEIKEGCEFIANPGSPDCMLPFPDDYYTVPDASSETGRKVDFKTEAMPANRHGEHIEAEPYDASNGFSPGSTILLRVPGINTTADVKAMKAVPINHIGGYAKRNTPVVVIDARTGARWPIWVEIDSKAEREPLLEIHPAINFTAGDRYIVALRDLKNKAREHLEAPAAFRYYRDNVPSEQEAINARRPEFEEIFSKLEAGGIQRSSLYLAWDFTVASDANNTARELAMRNDAFAQLGDTDLANGKPEGVSPSFAVTSVENEPYPGEVARTVKGTFEVPCFLFPSCEPGGRMTLNSEGDPIQNGTWTANFECIIPLSVTTGSAEAARPALYGHGLLGDASEVEASPQRSLSQGFKIVQCATDEIGMAESDVPVVIEALENLSKFPAIPDRLQQGLLDELYLGRVMISPTGFTTSPAFHQDGTLGTGSVLDTSHLFYNGNSQGGIMGGALTAVATDFTRASLGVGSMNYSVLVPRSVDFNEFEDLLDVTYPNQPAHPLAFDLIQMLWDRGEPDGYADRMTSDPLPDTPAHQVLMNNALGDHQVTNYQSEVEARTIGAYAHSPALYKGRWPNTTVLWKVPHIRHYPFTGSAFYYFDIGPIRESPSGSGKFLGVEPPPFENIPDTSGEDPHSAPRGSPATEQKLVSDFYNGAISESDTCENGPCYAGGFTGP
jgi:hypothetical protein